MHQQLLHHVQCGNAGLGRSLAVSEHTHMCHTSRAGVAGLGGTASGPAQYASTTVMALVPDSDSPTSNTSCRRPAVAGREMGGGEVSTWSLKLCCSEPQPHPRQQPAQQARQRPHLEGDVLQAQRGHRQRACRQRHPRSFHRGHRAVVPAQRHAAKPAPQRAPVVALWETASFGVGGQQMRPGAGLRGAEQRTAHAKGSRRPAGPAMHAPAGRPAGPAASPAASPTSASTSNPMRVACCCWSAVPLRSRRQHSVVGCPTVATNGPSCRTYTRAPAGQRGQGGGHASPRGLCCPGCISSHNTQGLHSCTPASWLPGSSPHRWSRPQRPASQASAGA